MSKTINSDSMQDYVEDTQGGHDTVRAKVLEQAEGLNYWGKKLASSKEAVVFKIVEGMIDEDTEESEEAQLRETVSDILKAATKPKKPKTEKVAKEKEPDNRPISAGALSHTESTRAVLEGNTFIITSAQNNTQVHREFLNNLIAYANFRDAKLIVYPFLYNKNGFQSGENQEVWFDPAIKPYLTSVSMWLGDGLKVAAMGFNILPTAKNPLSGLKEAVGSAEAMIVPHVTLAHECVAVLGAQYGAVVPQMYSTGTVTQRNYIQQAAGQKAENRHNFAALIVEFNKHGQFWVRQIETDESGDFHDLKTVVKDEVVATNNDNVSVLNYGDIHAEKINHMVANVQWGKDQDRASMLDYFRPNYQMAHDLLDFQALNHHNRDNHYHMAENQFTGRTVADDLTDVAVILGQMDRWFCQTIVVRSNHDDALDRWLQDSKYEPRKDPANALLYYKLQVLAYEHVKLDKHFDSLPLAIQEVTEEKPTSEVPEFQAKFLRASESFKVDGIELGEHGHSGTNGSRGSPKQFSAIKCTTGHTHTSSIYGGCYTAGVSGRLAMGYNETGASSWVHACVLQYKTGFRTIIHVKYNGDGQLDYMA